MVLYRNLVLLYEPEAAAMAIIKHQVQPLRFVEGSTFVVVDAGGGTVDITAHEVCKQHFCKQAAQQCIQLKLA